MFHRNRSAKTTVSQGQMTPGLICKGLISLALSLALSLSLDLSLNSTAHAATPAQGKSPGYQRYLEGHRLNETGNFEAALPILDDAISKDPQLADAYVSRGFSYSKLGKTKHALADYKRAAALSPNSPYAHNNLGFTYIRFGDYQSGIAELTTAINLLEDFAAAYSNRAEAYLRDGQYDKALKDVDKAISIDGSDHDSYETRAEVYMRKGDYAKAVKDFTLALEQEYNPSNGYHQKNASIFLRRKLLGLLSERDRNEAMRFQHQIHAAQTVRLISQIIENSDDGSTAQAILGRLRNEPGFDNLVCTVLDEDNVSLKMKVPINAELFCEIMPWDRAYAVSSDPHQSTWKIVLGKVATNSNAETTHISASQPTFGSWTIDPILTRRPEGELPQITAGASPAYSVGIYTCLISEVRLHRSHRF